MKGLGRRQCRGALKNPDVPLERTHFALQQGNAGAELYSMHFPPSTPFMEKKKSLILSEFQCFRLQMTSLNLSSQWHSEFANVMSCSFFRSLGPEFHQLVFPVSALHFSSPRFLVPRPSWPFHPTLYINVQ